MKIPEAIQNALVDEDLDAVESEWLVLAAERPGDLELFLRIADVLESLGEESRVSTLLGLLDEQLIEQELFEERLDLIEAAGKRYLKSGTVHAAAIETVKALYGGREDALEVLMPAVGLDQSKDATPKLWDKVHRLRNLLTYEVGTVVAMKDKGVGQIVEVNLALQTLKVDLEKIQGLSVGFRAAGKMLEVLHTDHVLYRKLNDPDSLRELKPSQLLQQVLQSYEKPLSGAQVKGIVVGLIEEKRWSSWWTTARKDPHVLVTGSGAKATYTWARSADDASDAVWQRFENAKLEKKLELLRRANQQNEDLLERMVEQISPLGEALLEADPATAFRVWDVLDRTSADITWQPHEVMTGLDDPLPVVNQLESRALRERAYAILREREDWLPLFQRRFLLEPDYKALPALAEPIEEAGREEFDDLCDSALSQPSKTPAAATWVAVRAAEDEDLRERRGPRILRMILAALSDDAFAPYRSLLESQCESGGTVPRILHGMDLEQARDAKAVIERSRGLERYQREPLLTALHLRFPVLEQDEEEPMYATRAAYEAKQAELKDLVENEIPANRKAIEEAREMGDLRENFEYKSARQRHEYLAARAQTLNDQIQRATILDPETINTDEVRVGTSLRLEGAKGPRKLTILGPWESDPDNDIVSHESDLARTILGKEVGSTVAIADDEYEITAIERFDASD